MNRIGLVLIFATMTGFYLNNADIALSASQKDIQKAYTELTLADHWRKARAASDKLSTFGEAALPTILEGAKNEKKMVKEYCYEILRSKFPKHDKSIQAIIDGLNDNNPKISYPCAFHLGVHHIVKAKKALKTSLKDKSKDVLTRYAAAKSLAELGEQEVMTMLYEGLGSEHHYTRYLSNIGIKALSGKDLTDFGYEDPWEGASVLGGVVGLSKSDPIVRAKRIVRRWQAIVLFLEWLKKEKPELFERIGYSLVDQGTAKAVLAGFTY